MTTKLVEKIEALVKEKKLSPETLQKVLNADRDPWEAARGILKGKKIDVLKYQRQIRKEWEK